MLTRDAIWQALEDVPDPEIPMVSLVEMGIVRDVEIGDKTVTVTITPTFSGCPALQVMKDEIVERLKKEEGISDVTVETTYSPPWTTDWIAETARDKLKDFGITPPPRLDGTAVEIVLFEPVACPQCGSTNTSIKNNWGPTPCKTIHYCNSCNQPFESFKPL
ncbi:MAG: 1,2-phenylacetyl-CoA epoxidase subunit PaaD [Anaerolineae bacterium]